MQINHLFVSDSFNKVLNYHHLLYHLLSNEYLNNLLIIYSINDDELSREIKLNQLKSNIIIK